MVPLQEMRLILFFFLFNSSYQAGTSRGHKNTNAYMEGGQGGSKKLKE